MYRTTPLLKTMSRLLPPANEVFSRVRLYDHYPWCIGPHHTGTTPPSPTPPSPPRTGLPDMFKLVHYEPHGVVVIMNLMALWSLWTSWRCGHYGPHDVVDIFLPVDFKYFVGKRMFSSKIKIKHWGWRQCKILLTSTRLPSHYFCPSSNQ